MPTPQISRAARARIRQRLANVTTGFNPYLVAALADAGITAPAGWKLPIDFSSSPSLNFFEADLTADELDETSPITYPCMTLFALGATEGNLEKYKMFSGVVTFGLNIFCSWVSSRALPDFETVTDCVEEALYQTFNGSANPAWATDSVLVFNGELSCQRSGLSKNAENWFQTLACKLTCEVHANG